MLNKNRKTEPVKHRHDPAPFLIAVGNVYNSCFCSENVIDSVAVRKIYLFVARTKTTLLLLLGANLRPCCGSERSTLMLCSGRIYACCWCGSDSIYAIVAVRRIYVLVAIRSYVRAVWTNLRSCCCSDRIYVLVAIRRNLSSC